MSGSNRQEPLPRAMIGLLLLDILRGRQTKPSATILPLQIFKIKRNFLCRILLGPPTNGETTKSESDNYKTLKFKDHLHYSSSFYHSFFLRFSSFQLSQSRHISLLGSLTSFFKFHFSLFVLFILFSFLFFFSSSDDLFVFISSLQSKRRRM